MKNLELILLQANGDRALAMVFFACVVAAMAYAIGCIGRKRKIGFSWAFAISLLNPLLGLIITLCSKKKDVEFIEVNKND